MTVVSLSRREQVRNVAIYAAMNALVYLSAPVVYVGITQASLCAGLGASDTVANLPNSAFFWATIVPFFVALHFHKTSSTSPVLVAAYLAMAAAGLLVAASLWWPASVQTRLALVVLYGGLIGAGLGVRNVFIWEVVNRGIAPEMRGLAYSLSFGLGPLFAVIGSLGAQLILSGEVQLPTLSTQGITLASWQVPALSFPLNFAALFGATAPILGLAALMASRFVLPRDQGTRAEPRPTLLAGLTQAGDELARDRVLVLAILAYVLVDGGFTITNNMSLFTIEALGRPAEQFAGYQNALRFSCKMVAGILMGWLLVRTHAKMGMLVTGLLCLSGILWVLLMPRGWFLMCFGLMGAGELYAVYYSNYIMARSRPERLRQNMAVLQLLSLATSFAPAGFGLVSDYFGLSTSFVAAGAIVATSLAIIIVGLPAKPIPLVEADASVG